MISAISVILPVKALIFIIVSVIAMSATAVSNRYLWGRPLPYFSNSCGSALSDSWGLANKGTGLASSTGSCNLTGSCGSNR